MLQERLREAIREELGGTYSISVSPSAQKIPRPEYLLSVQFGCDPQRVDVPFYDEMLSWPPGLRCSWASVC